MSGVTQNDRTAPETDTLLSIQLSSSYTIFNQQVAPLAKSETYLNLLYRRLGSCWRLFDILLALSLRLPISRPERRLIVGA